LPLSQFEGQRPAIGSEVEFTVERFDPQQRPVCADPQRGGADGRLVQRRPGQIVEARVTGVNRGGLSVEVNNIRGFLPISQIDLYRVDVPEQYFNQRLRCLVTEIDPDTQNLVVSRRALLEREREEQREQFWAELAEGQIREGLVRSIRPFGVFVDLGAADGLIPISELAWTKTDDPASVVSVGQRVQVKVVRIDPASRKISLSLRALTTSPWDDLAKRLRVGAVVEGKVTRTTEFGAFVELEPGIEGLIHISELSPNRTRRVREVVQEGQQVQVMVLAIDPEARRIALSLKACKPRRRQRPKPRRKRRRRHGPRPKPRPRPPPPRHRPAHAIPNLRGGIGRPIHISLPPRPEQ
jgi:small subunit ribosomal protein S1